MKRFFMAVLFALSSLGVTGEARADLALYTIGDIDSYYAALNGVAMMFDDTGNPATESGLITQKSSGVRTLGPIMLIGLLISLIFVAISGIMRQELRLDHLLVSILLAYFLFVPRTTVVLEDVYSGQIKTVANVPYGIALPGALISTFTKTFSEKMETAFSVPAAQPLITGGTPGGFMDPLKILMTMRNMNVCESNKSLCDNLFEYMRYCLADSSGNRIDMNDVMQSSDPMTALLTGSPVAGLTYYRNDFATVAAFGFTPARLKDGVTLTCAQAGPQIYADADFYRTNVGSLNSFANDFAYALKERKLGASAGVGAAPGAGDTGGATARGRLDRAVAGFQVASILNDQKAAELSLIYRNPAIAAMMAAGQPDRAVAYQVFVTSAMHQYQVDAAADGTMFLKTMLPSMSILTFFFFAFSPIVAMMIMMMGLHSIKIAISYLMFGLWTQSWMPGAVIVNYFTQLQFMGAMGGHGGVGKDAFIAWAHQPDLFETIATNLAVGANMLAAVPVVMMALMAGSAYGLSKLADTVGSSRKGYFDEKSVAADAGTASNASAFMRSSSEGGMDPRLGLSGVMPYHQQTMGTMNLADTASQSVTAARTAQASYARQMASSASTIADHALTSGKEVSSAHGIHNEDRTALTKFLSSQFGESKGTEDSTRFQSSLQSGTSAAFNAGMGAAFNAAIPFLNAGDKAGAAKAFENAFKPVAQNVMSASLLKLGVDGQKSAQVAEQFATMASAKASEQFSANYGTRADAATAVAQRRDNLMRDSAGDNQSLRNAWQTMSQASQGYSAMESAVQQMGRTMSAGGNFSFDIAGLYGRMGGAAGVGPTLNAVGESAKNYANGLGSKAAEDFAAGLAKLSQDPNRRDAFLHHLGSGMISGDANVRSTAMASYAELGSRSGMGGVPLLGQEQVALLRSGADLERRTAMAMRSTAGATGFDVTGGQGAAQSSVAGEVRAQAGKAENQIDATGSTVQGQRTRLDGAFSAARAAVPGQQGAMISAGQDNAADFMRRGANIQGARNESNMEAHNRSKNFVMDMMSHAEEISAKTAGGGAAAVRGLLTGSPAATEVSTAPAPESAATRARAPGSVPPPETITLEPNGEGRYGSRGGGGAVIPRSDGGFVPGGQPAPDAGGMKTVQGETIRAGEGGAPAEAAARAGGGGGGSGSGSFWEAIKSPKAIYSGGAAASGLLTGWAIGTAARDSYDAYKMGDGAAAVGVWGQTLTEVGAGVAGGLVGGAVAAPTGPVGVVASGFIVGYATSSAAGKGFTSVFPDYRARIHAQREAVGEGSPTGSTPTLQGEYNKAHPFDKQ